MNPLIRSWLPVLSRCSGKAAHAAPAGGGGRVGQQQRAESPRSEQLGWGETMENVKNSWDINII